MLGSCSCWWIIKHYPMAFYWPYGEWEGSPGMMYFRSSISELFGSPEFSKSQNVGKDMKGLDLNELVTSVDNFLAPGASVKVQIHVSISTVFFMKTWAAWWTAFAGMVILGRGDWHFKIDEPLRGGNRFNHFPQKVILHHNWNPV